MSPCVASRHNAILSIAMMTCEMNSAVRLAGIVMANPAPLFIDNGLERSWHGKVFLNPPFAQPAISQSLTSLREKLIKIGAKVVGHGRYIAFQMAEVAIPRQLFADILRLIAELRPPPDEEAA